VLLTRAPLYSWYCYHFLVRLACVRHAASVDSEPGSNSRLKPDVNPSLTEVRSGSTAPAHLFRRRGCTQALLPCENDQAKPDPFSRLACSTNLSKILEGSPPERALLDRGPSCYAGVSSNLLRSPISAFYSIFRRFCANLLMLSNFQPCVKLNLTFA
jgi:hypothetical protein